MENILGKKKNDFVVNFKVNIKVGIVHTTERLVIADMMLCNKQQAKSKERSLLKK